MCGEGQECVVKVDGGLETCGGDWKCVAGGCGCSECMAGGQKYVMEVRNGHFEKDFTFEEYNSTDQLKMHSSKVMVILPTFEL